MKLETNWDTCPDWIPDQSVGILWTVTEGIPIRYHWNHETKILHKVVGSESQPLGLCLDLDQALSIALQTFGSIHADNT